MEIPEELVFQAIDEYKASLDHRLVNSLMDREVHVKVYGGSQTLLIMKDKIKEAIEQYIKENGL